MMRQSLIVSANPDDAAEAVGWLTARLVAAGLPKARSETVAARLGRAWSELLPHVFPRSCQAQILMLEIDGGSSPEVALLGERRGRLSAGLLTRAKALGFSPEPETGMDGLLRMRLSL